MFIVAEYGMMLPMTKTIITLYGIPNCDTVKKARNWLSSHQLDSQFIDFKRLGVPEDRLDVWLEALGSSALINARGITWRKLDETTRANATDARGARALMLAQPSVIKRPVVEWANGEISVGFDEENWRSRVA